ncbi:hypothetical protein R3P38DRAFT_3202599 [Favolaschia claudopus]|uniref:IBB domain-containing protein n=1 Tax=Favolaschia claudopus TaxID=2862362 RepID=A0AAW0AW55_9AGAR
MLPRKMRRSSSDITHVSDSEPEREALRVKMRAERKAKRRQERENLNPRLKDRDDKWTTGNEQQAACQTPEVSKNGPGLWSTDLLAVMYR